MANDPSRASRKAFSSQRRKAAHGYVIFDFDKDGNVLRIRRDTSELSQGVAKVERSNERLRRALHKKMHNAGRAARSYKKATASMFLLLRPFAIANFVAMTRSAVLRLHNHARELDKNYEALHGKFRTAFDTGFGSIVGSETIKGLVQVLTEAVNDTDFIKELEEQSEKWSKDALPAIKAQVNAALFFFQTFRTSLLYLGLLFNVLKSNALELMMIIELGKDMKSGFVSLRASLETSMAGPWVRTRGIPQGQTVLEGPFIDLIESHAAVQKRIAEYTSDIAKIDIRKYAEAFWANVKEMMGLRPDIESETTIIDPSKFMIEETVKQLDATKALIESANKASEFFGGSLSVGFERLSKSLREQIKLAEEVGDKISPSVKATADLTAGFALLASQVEQMSRGKAKVQRKLMQARLIIVGTIGLINSAIEAVKSAAAFPNIPKMIAHAVAATMLAAAAGFAFYSAGAGGGAGSVRTPQVDELKKNRAVGIGSIILIVDDSMFASERESAYITRNILYPIAAGARAPAGEVDPYSIGRRKSLSTDEIIESLVKSILLIHDPGLFFLDQQIFGGTISRFIDSVGDEFKRTTKRIGKEVNRISRKVFGKKKKRRRPMTVDELVQIVKNDIKNRAKDFGL